MQAWLTDFADRLAGALEPQFEALYLYGSAAAGGYDPDKSDINLLLLVADDTRVQTVYDAFQPLWEIYQRPLKQAPDLLTPATLDNHMQLAPLLSSHLKEHAVTLWGSAEFLTTLPNATPAQQFAAQAHNAMGTSNALFDAELPTAEILNRRRQLHSILRQLTHQPVSAEADDLSCYKAIQAVLHPHTTPPPAMPANPIAPGLYSIMKNSPRHVVFVFDELSAERIESTNWASLAAEFVPTGYHSFAVTFSQIQQVIQYETAINRAFNRCSILWGSDPFVGLELHPLHVMRHAGRNTSILRMKTLPHDYLTADTPDDAQLIHDFQNRVLNIHLEHEILCRLNMCRPFEENRTLPNRHLPNIIRINKIFSHLDEWVAFYADQVNQFSA